MWPNNWMPPTPLPAANSSMTPRRANLLGFLLCVGLLAYAYYSEYVLHLEPCPLCIFQRVGVFMIGGFFLAAAAHDPRTMGARVYAALIALASLATAGVATRHLYIQSLPPGSVPACGATLDFMLRVLPLRQVLGTVLTGSGECAKVTWRFAGLAMPAWVLIAAAGLGIFGVWNNLRRRVPILRF
jgi:protein dithiol:quinone oxidoreductase